MGLEYLNIFGNIEITWSQWLLTTLMVFAIYWVIRLANKTLEKASLLGGWKERAYKIVHKVFVMAEPISLFIIISSFVLINPLFHGIMAFVLLMLSYNLLKSYFSGRVLLVNNALFFGQKIKVKQSEGFIQNIGRTSLTLQTKQGIEYIAYVHLFENGYTQLQGKKVGGLQALYIEGNEEEILTIQHIQDKLWESPYLDWSFDPEITITNIQNQFEVKILLRERSHLEEFKNLINEWGYKCRLKN